MLPLHEVVDARNEKDAGSRVPTREPDKRQILKLRKSRRGRGRSPASLEQVTLNIVNELGMSIREMEEHALNSPW